jgi:hypothetical protein
LIFLYFLKNSIKIFISLKVKKKKETTNKHENLCIFMFFLINRLFGWMESFNIFMNNINASTQKFKPCNQGYWCLFRLAFFCNLHVGVEWFDFLIIKYYLKKNARTCHTRASIWTISAPFEWHMWHHPLSKHHLPERSWKGLIVVFPMTMRM